MHMAASSRPSRGLPESPASTRQLLLLTNNTGNCDGSACSDGDEDEDEGNFDSSLPSKSSFHVSAGPVIESFGCASRTRSITQRFWRNVPTFFSRAFRPRWNCSSNNQTCGPILGFESTLSQRPKPVRRLTYICLAILVLLGIVQLFALAFGVIAAFFPDDIHSVIEHWGQVGRQGRGLDRWPTDFSRDIIPIPCHSHNDYWRKVPLYSAISAGCTGVEADIWQFDGELYIGHTTSSLTRNRTLRNLYINPLVDILDKQNPIHRYHPNASNPLNGIFDTKPSQTLTLLIDFKTSGPAAFPHVASQLAPLRERGYLSYFNGKNTVPGPLTIVATGNAPFNDIIRNTKYRDIFFDAPLMEMGAAGRKWANPDALSAVDIEYQRNTTLQSAEPKDRRMRSRFLPQNQEQGASGRTKNLDPDVYSPQNSYYASASLPKAIGHLWHSKLQPLQITRLREQVRGAHRRGLKARYWNLPKWPIGLRNQVWQIMVEEGVDMLNVDDLQSAAKKDWKTWKGWWSGRVTDHAI